MSLHRTFVIYKLAKALIELQLNVKQRLIPFKFPEQMSEQRLENLIVAIAGNSRAAVAGAAVWR